MIFCTFYALSTVIIKKSEETSTDIFALLKKFWSIEKPVRLNARTFSSLLEKASFEKLVRSCST
jgi:hypothetical protein